MENIVMLGYGGHAKSVSDCIEETGEYTIVGYTDIEKKDCEYTYLGTDDSLEKLYRSGIRNAIVCVGYLGKDTVRDQLYKRLKNIGFMLPPIISSHAILSKGVTIGEGSFIGKAAIVNSDSKVGKMCIINTAAVIEHDCVINDFVHVSVASVLCGGVRVGERAFIGAGATIIQNKSIDANMIIPAGTVVR